MKIIFLITSILVSSSLHAGNSQWVEYSKRILKKYEAECKVAAITVEQIVKNSHIKGHVTGLPESALEDFRMIFYVKTKSWYVHPYEYNQNQPSGYSFSDLTAGGNFWIRSVFRTPAKEMVAILVPSPHYIYAKKSRMKDLLKYACTHMTIPGNGDFSP